MTTKEAGVDVKFNKEIVQRGKIALFWRKFFARSMFPVQRGPRVDLEFLDAKAKKRVRERNTLPLISWTIEKDVEALSNKQLKMYLKQKGLKITREP